ncbi:Uncharacterised protein [Vibrio cholerae]|nr:Uncharacterised protein [Vibrio cholerae]
MVCALSDAIPIWRCAKNWVNFSVSPSLSSDSTYTSTV